MDDDWALISALMGGTRSMRDAGALYMPKRPMEEASDYAARLQLSTLYPAFSETVKSMAGRVFARPLIEGDDIPGWIADDVLPDIDRQGRNLHVFARDWFAEALTYGLSHALVESPRADGVRTKLQQRAAGIRPYVIQIAPERIIGWRTDDSGKLEQVRIRFSRQEPDGEFGTRSIEQIRVYEIGLVRTFEKIDGEWREVGEPVEMALDRIPLITLYTGRTAPLVAAPPLRELAYLNAKHWRLQSSMDSLVETSCVPILAMYGVQENDKIVIGAKHAIRFPVADAKMEYVEHTGAAIGSGNESLASLEDAMRQAGAKLLQPREVTKTATQASEEAARENSALAAMVEDFEDTVHDLLDLLAEWRGQATGGTVQTQPNLDADTQPIESMSVLREMRNDGDLSGSTLFAEAKRRGIIADDTRWEDEQERIASEVMR